MEVHYINTGCPYTITESFMDFFEGLSHVPVNYAQAQAAQPMHDPVIVLLLASNLLLRSSRQFTVMHM